MTSLHNTTLVVGCPVRDRAWILPDWFERVEAACDIADLTPHYIFVAGRDDTPTVACLHTETTAWRRSCRIELTDEPHRSDERCWDTSRYDHMAFLRNSLLADVREADPDLFWSLDSDILANPNALDSAARQLGRFDAVGMRCYMSNGTAAPSYGLWGAGGFTRYDSEGCFGVDIIMAAKLMSRAAYNVDYRADLNGEDIGWSKACRDAGLKLGWDGQHVSKHVMSFAALNEVDDRVGY